MPLDATLMLSPSNVMRARQQPVRQHHVWPHVFPQPLPTRLTSSHNPFPLVKGCAMLTTGPRFTGQRFTGPRFTGPVATRTGDSYHHGAPACMHIVVGDAPNTARPPHAVPQQLCSSRLCRPRRSHRVAPTASRPPRRSHRVDPTAARPPRRAHRGAPEPACSRPRMLHDQSSCIRRPCSCMRLI